MMTFIVNSIGIVLILLIIWWFLIAKPKAKRSTTNKIDIIVQNGVYEPAMIKAKKGQTLHLRFIRKDDTPCSEFVIFDQLNLSSQLPFEKPHVITVKLKKRGEFDFTCQMGMYRGKLIVE